jgi:hypothetical protein
MNIRLTFLVLGVLAYCGSYPSTVDAAAVVLENQTTGNIDFTIHWPNDKDSRHTLVAGDIRPIAVTDPIGIAFDADGLPHRHRLQPNGIYIFVRRNEKLELTELRLPSIGISYSDHAASSSDRATPDATDSICSIPVKILADDQEPTVRAVWEKRLRDRLNAASDIFERCCRVRFKVVAVDTWAADQDISEFDQSVVEFERKVRPSPGRIAIGFTGHYKWDAGETHVGAIRGPLRSHILIREALVRVSEPERLEVLVHELGHFLGAAHSADGNSVMRPTLGDRRSCARGFRIGFDAPNTLAMYLIGEEFRQQPLDRLRELSLSAKNPLRGIYAWLAQTLPNDPAAPKYKALLGMPFPATR